MIVIIVVFLIMVAVSVIGYMMLKKKSENPKLVKQPVYGTWKLADENKTRALLVRECTENCDSSSNTIKQELVWDKIESCSKSCDGGEGYMITKDTSGNVVRSTYKYPCNTTPCIEKVNLGSWKLISDNAFNATLTRTCTPIDPKDEKSCNELDKNQYQTLSIVPLTKLDTCSKPCDNGVASKIFVDPSGNLLKTTNTYACNTDSCISKVNLSNWEMNAESNTGVVLTRKCTNKDPSLNACEYLNTNTYPMSKYKNWSSFVSCSKACDTGIGKQQVTDPSDGVIVSTKTYPCNTDLCISKVTLSNWKVLSEDASGSTFTRTCVSNDPSNNACTDLNTIQYPLQTRILWKSDVSACPAPNSCYTGQYPTVNKMLVDPSNNTYISTNKYPCPNQVPCPVDCVYTWNDWSVCDKTCGGGKQTRTARVTTPAANNGKACPVDETRDCNTQSCYLYDFTTHKFTNAGATGRTGPTLQNCQSAYSGQTWAQNTTNFNVSNGVQQWKCPRTGTYTITIAGAAGAYYVPNNSSMTGVGLGVQYTTTVNLTQGNTYGIVVGQRATPTTSGDTSNGGGAGGGGSFVWNTTGSSLICAAGGGGGRAIDNVGSPNLVTETYGLNGTSATQGTLFNYASSKGYGTYYRANNGQSGGQWASASAQGYSTTGGKGWTEMIAANDFTGRNEMSYGSIPGFGGGSATSDHNGGGGGGYSGGGEVNYYIFSDLHRSGGGGGGSYSIAPMTNVTTNSAEHGFVTITFVS